MVNHDPAREATLRACQAHLAKWEDPPPRREFGEFGEAAAREALAPIRQILDDYEGDPINAVEALRTHLEGGAS